MNSKEKTIPMTVSHSSRSSSLDCRKNNKITKVNGFKDESTSKRRANKGDIIQMATAANLNRSRNSAAYKLSHNRFENINKISDSMESSSSNNRFYLESTFYCILKTAALVLVLVGFNLGFGFSFGNYSLMAISIIAVILQLLTLAIIPTQDIVPIRKERIRFSRFVSAEFKFAVFLSSIFFFLNIQSSIPVFGLFLLANFGLQTVLFLIWRKYNRHFLKPQNLRTASVSEKKVIIVGASGRGKKAADLFFEHPDLNVRVIGFVDRHNESLWRYRDIPLLGHPDLLEDIIASNKVDHVVLATEPGDYIYSREIFGKIEQMGIDICVLPDIYDLKISRCRASSINGQPLLMYRSACISDAECLAKGIMDKIGAAVGLLIASPILIFSAIAIKLDSRGPVFYKQTRSGKNGKPFEMFKLRTMVNGADQKQSELQYLNEMSGPVFKIKKDPRVTRIGKFLRKYSIDEFPQFINILMGDMSLVGPRPPLPSEISEYEPWQRRKLSVKPGATCLWQINGRNHVDFDKWMNLDLSYIDNWSLKEDIRILLKTFPAVLKGNGAS